MALLVLLSTVSFTVEKHYCGDVLIDVAVFAKAKKCTSGLEEVQCKTCCKEEIDLIKGQEVLKVSSNEDFGVEHQLMFLQAFAQTYCGLFESLPKPIIPYKNYSPPNLITDIQLLDQVFII